MLHCKHLLSLGLACAMLLSPLSVTGQKAEPQSQQSSDAWVPVVRSLELRYLGKYDTMSLEEVHERLVKRVVLPLSGKPYNQNEVDRAKAIIREMFRALGFTVGIDSMLRVIPDTHLAHLAFVVYKD